MDYSILKITVYNSVSILALEYLAKYKSDIFFINVRQYRVRLRTLSYTDS